MEQTFWYNDPAMDHLPFPPSSALASCMQPPRLPVHHLTASRVSDLKHRIPPPELFFFVPGKSTLYSRAEAASGRHRPHPPLVWRMPAPRPRRQPFLILLSSFLCLSVCGQPSPLGQASCSWLFSLALGWEKYYAKFILGDPTPVSMPAPQALSSFFFPLAPSPFPGGGFELDLNYFFRATCAWNLTLPHGLARSTVKWPP